MNDAQSKTAGSEVPVTFSNVVIEQLERYRCKHIRDGNGDGLSLIDVFAIAMDASDVLGATAELRTLAATLPHPATQAGALQAVPDERAAFERAMVDAGYDKPELGSGGGYLFQRDEDRFVGWSLAATQPNAAPAADCNSCQGTGSGGMGVGCTDCLGTGVDPAWRPAPAAEVVALTDVQISDISTGFVSTYVRHGHTFRDFNALPFARAVIKAALAAPAAEVVAGQWVPAQPTKAMQDAWDTAPTSEDTDEEFRNGYRAMLAAAPTTGQGNAGAAGYEHYAAIREGHRNAAEDAWFSAIPGIEPRRAFQAGFDAGYNTRDLAAPAAAIDAREPESSTALSKACDLLSMSIGTLMSAKQKIGYVDRSPIARLIAEAVEFLRPWPEQMPVAALASRSESPEARPNAAGQEQGWQWVPVEPTRAMIEAGATADPERESVWAAYLRAAPPLEAVGSSGMTADQAQGGSS